MLAGQLDAAHRRSHRLETSITIAFQQQAPACIHSWKVGASAKKVLRQKQILTAVSVEIGYRDPEHRGQLRFERERDNIKCIAAIDHHDGLKRGEPDGGQFAFLFAQNIR